MNNVVLGLYVSWVITNTFVSNHCTSNVWAGVIVVWDVKGPNTRDLEVWIILIFEWKSANASLQCSHIYDVLLIPISSLLYSVVWSDHGCGSWCCPGPRLTARVRCWPLSQPSLRAAPASSEAPANNHLYHTRSYTTAPPYSGHQYTTLLPLSQVLQTAVPPLPVTNHMTGRRIQAKIQHCTF